MLEVGRFSKDSNASPWHRSEGCNVFKVTHSTNTTPRDLNCWRANEYFFS
jgi:hypothetical protein